MPRKSAEEYAQERRDQEVSARIELKGVIPEELFTGKLADGDKTFSISAKIMIAATELINSLKKARPKGARTSAPPPRDPRVAMLHQAMVRCIQTAEQKAQEADDVDGELKDVVETGYDLLVDLNDMLQQGSMTDKQRTKWAQEQEAWGKGFYLQK
ncbi:hypothetical protein DV737_g4963, partial [Chaetothyriales sp. CBS 132003]